jgi:hypothetical protein
MKPRKGPLLALTSALMAATSASTASAWENPLENPYLDEPLEVCDQGSFFVGGVPKVTKYAAGPTAGGAANGRLSSFTARRTRARRWIRRRMARRAGIPMPCVTIWRRSLWTSRGVGVRALTNPCFTRPRRPAIGTWFPRSDASPTTGRGPRGSAIS